MEIGGLEPPTSAMRTPRSPIELYPRSKEYNLKSMGCQAKRPLTKLAYLVIILLVANVQPFLGLRYEPRLVGSLSQVIAPPYDVLPPEELPKYLAKSPYNVVRLEGAAEPSHHLTDAEHAQAATLLSTWIQEGVLRRESRPAFYLVEHRSTYQGKSRSCWSLLCRVRLEDPRGGQIYLHETTSSEPVRYRLLRLRYCRANLSPIIALFPDELSFPQLLPEALSCPPAATAEENGVIYNLWVIERESEITQISDFFAAKPLYLADGHHRYEAARLYQQEAPASGQANHRNFVLMSLFNAEDPGLQVLPVHRLVKGLASSELPALEEKLKLYFWVRELPASQPAIWLARLGEEGRRAKAIGFYQPFSRKFMLLSPRWDKLQRLFPPDAPPLLRELELHLLHRVILQELLGIKSVESEEQHLSYHTDGFKAIDQATEKGELAFLLNPLLPSQIMALAQADLQLPRKSSYFYPKTPAGLVINPLWD